MSSAIWSFNLRSTKTNHDSDSDSDFNDDLPSNSISEETRLLQDLDISHREETVVYKPNPFSIAKINAAARRTHVPPAPAVDHTAKPASKKPTGRIVDSFKKTQQKKSSNSVTKSNALDPNSDAIASPTVKFPIASPPHNATTAISIPRMDGTEPKDRTTSPELIRVDAPEIPSPVDAGPGVVLPQAADDMYAHISAASPRSVPQKRSLAPNSSSFTLKDPATPTIPKSNARNVLPLTHTIHTSISTTSPNRVVKKFRPSAPNFFPSPLKVPSPGQRGSGAIANPVFFSSPLHSAALNTASIGHKYSRGKSSQAFEMHTTAYHPHSTHVPRSGAVARIFPSNSADAGSHPTLITPSSSTSRSKPLRTTFEPLDFRCVAEISSNPYEPGVGVASAYPPSRPRDACSQYDLNLPPSSPIRSPIPTPRPSPRRKREGASKLLPPKKSHRSPKHQTSNAYDYFSSDPDDEWSTLPARKKLKVAEPARPGVKGIKTSGTFRLPGTAAKAKVSGMSATSARRVITFLPPPLKAGKVEVLVADSNTGTEDEVQLDVDAAAAPPRVPKHSRESSPPQETPKRRRTSQNPYPSPADSRLAPGTAAIQVTVHANILSSPSPIRPSAHRFLSPPTSDPVPDQSLEMHATVAMDGVSQRYPRTKSLMRRRNRGADGVWTLLELPSCGIVHGDDEDHSPSRELPVVVWQGQKLQVP
ncbi:hypothetical protein B0H12DRAFT_1325162 [Mycena haematopus]|nr:hypothetical protein B0H12DRAFT_1325162 [Mycena haematopus]